MNGSPLVLHAAVRLLFPLLLVFSAFLLFRGHNEPGGGFVGGLVAASAFALVLVADGADVARRLLRVEPLGLLAGGLLLALASGLVPLAAGLPFLTGLWLGTPLPGIGKLGGPLVFDVGVYFTVLGVVMTMFLALAEED